MHLFPFPCHFSWCPLCFLFYLPFPLFYYFFSAFLFVPFTSAFSRFSSTFLSSFFSVTLSVGFLASVLLSRQSLLRQACFFLFGPPNLVRSLHISHIPQSSLVHPAHTLHRLARIGFFTSFLFPTFTSSFSLFLFNFSADFRFSSIFLDVILTVRVGLEEVFLGLAVFLFGWVWIGVGGGDSN